ncbi:MAG: M23 family metallopeptidase [Fimbriimonadaceae bacterium]
MCCLGLLAASVVGASNWKAHPEWGPPPPVAPFGRKQLPQIHHVVGMYFPVLGNPWFNNDYNVNRGRYRHTGIDIRAPKMTPIVAPFAGIIGMKHETFWIDGDDGWTVLGTHLNDDNIGTHDRSGNRDVEFAPDLVPGQHVEAGRFIGYVGMSGNATGPHLHFELYAPGKGPTMRRIRSPLASLKVAIRLRRPLVTPMDVGDKPNPGNLRLDGCIRGINEKSKSLYLILVAAEHAREARRVVTQVRFVRVTVPLDVADAAGGWQALAQQPSTLPITVFVHDNVSLTNETVLRMHLNEPQAAIQPQQPPVTMLLRRLHSN